MKQLISDIDLYNLSRDELIAQLNESHRKLREFEQDRARINTLYFITRNLSQELDLDNLLRLLMDEVKDILQADRCTVFLLDNEQGELWSRIGHGLEINEIRFSIDKGIAGYVAKTGGVVKIDDCYGDSRFNPDVDRKTGYRTRNMLAFPMRNKLLEIIGVFQVLNKHSGGFTDQDVQMLEAIAPIAAVQIENAQLYDEARQTFESFIMTLSEIIDARDPLTAGHSQRIMLLADSIAKEAEWSAEQRSVLKTAALLHDLGKIGVRESVLTKKGKLTEDEYRHVKSHVSFTRSFLERIRFSRDYKQVLDFAATHHERLDGSGYPQGLKGDQIPPGGRILAIADVFDAMTSQRHYRERMDFRKVMEHLEELAGVELDSGLFESFKNLSLDTIIKILEHENLDQISQADLATLRKCQLRAFLQGSSSTENTHNFEEVFFKYYHKEYLARS